MFEYLKPFNKIVVTGPARSGTTIAAKMIADELGYIFVDESCFDGGSIKKFNFFLRVPKKLVVQMTCMIGAIHTLGKGDDLAIVLMRRNIDDINNSIDNTLELPSYSSERDKANPDNFSGCTEAWKKNFLDKYGITDLFVNIPKIVYNFWDDFQKYQINHYFEIEYESLKNHPLWIDKLVRKKHFTDIKQINFDPDYIQGRKGEVITQCLT